MRGFCFLAVVVSMTAIVKPVGAASLALTSATVSAPGDSAEVCVSLTSAGAEIAGIQNDIVWDGTCATLASPDNCRVAGIPQYLAVAYPADAGDFVIRAILLSFTDVSPIPDGPLYCCSVRIDAPPSACCPMQITNAMGASPTGNALPLSGNVAELCVRDDPPVPTPTTTPVSVLSDSSGCEISSRSSFAGLPLAIAMLLLSLRRASCWRRRRGLDRDP